MSRRNLYNRLTKYGLRKAKGESIGRQTQAAYKVLASAGDGSMKSLTKGSHINQQVLLLAFGEQWQSQVASFGRGLSPSSSSLSP